MEPTFDQIAGLSFGTFALVAGLIVVWLGRAVVLRWMDISAAKGAVRHEQEHQRVLLESTRALDAVSEQLKRLDAIEGRLADIERILREVDEPVLVRR